VLGYPLGYTKKAAVYFQNEKMPKENGYQIMVGQSGTQKQTRQNNEKLYI
jgi:hypothetical protein